MALAKSDGIGNQRGGCRIRMSDAPSATRGRTSGCPRPARQATPQSAGRRDVSPRPMASPTATLRDTERMWSDAEAVACFPVPRHLPADVATDGILPHPVFRFARERAPEHTASTLEYVPAGRRAPLRPRSSTPTEGVPKIRCHGPREGDCDALTVKRRTEYGRTGHPLSIRPPAKSRRSQRQPGRHRRIPELRRTA